MTLLIAVLFIVTSIVFSWPWVSPHWTRRDASQRLLDRLQEEWEREDDPGEKDYVNW